MSERKYTISLNGLPDHEHIIFKLICSVSERTKNRVQTYHLNDDQNMTSDIYINDINNKSSLNETSSLPLNVWVTSKHDESANSIVRPLIATRVLHILDRLVESSQQSADDIINNSSSKTLELSENNEPFDFNITEEEASELAIVHDEILENPSNQQDLEIVNDSITKAPGLTVINGTTPCNINNNKKDIHPQVLVVDDSASVRKQLEIELEFFDAQIDFAESAESAFNLLQNKKYDVALLDVVLPDKDGFQICKHIKSEDKSTIAIMLTGKATQSDKIKGSLAGCNAYLVKPVGRQTFQNTIKNYLPLKSNIAALKA